ncbi:MAG: alpha/beta hydrolase [Desulfohalobiaceae bacterium]|nr:alpha/beta hydrolase [Desulfohalobiaceae bacterium]
MMSNILIIILFIISGYLVISGLAYFFQNSLIYFPDPLIQATPEEIGLEYEEITFTTADGVRLHGWFVPYPTKQYLREGTCPLLIVHSRDDEIVPFSFGRTLFEKAGPPKEFLELSGGHNDGFLVSGDEYTDGVGSFLRRFGPLASE